MNIIENNIKSLLHKYDKIMLLKIFVHEDDELKEKYKKAIIQHNHNILNNTFIDAGFDIFLPKKQNQNTQLFNEKINKIDFNISCSAIMFCDNNKQYYTGYSMEHRSSIYKTNLRLANSRGIIDSGYRGHIMGIFDLVNSSYIGNAYDRYLQICAPGFQPILVEMVDSINDLSSLTERNQGGFGSTGK